MIKLFPGRSNDEYAAMPPSARIVEAVRLKTTERLSALGALMLPVTAVVMEGLYVDEALEKPLLYAVGGIASVSALASWRMARSSGRRLLAVTLQQELRDELPSNAVDLAAFTVTAEVADGQSPLADALAAADATLRAETATSYIEIVPSNGTPAIE